MSIIGNILWIILGGFIIFLEYLFAGLLLCITIIGIPFGLQCFKLAHLGLVPFGKEVVGGPTATGAVSVIFNILWIITAGLIVAFTHLVLALILAVTIIGIPFSIQHLKLANLALTPFGHSVK